MQSFVSESRDRHSMKNNRVTWLAPGHALPSNLLWFALIKSAGSMVPRHKEISVRFFKTIIFGFWSLYFWSLYSVISLCFYIVLLTWAGIDMWTSFAVLKTQRPHAYKKNATTLSCLLGHLLKLILLKPFHFPFLTPSPHRQYVPHLLWKTRA